MACSSRSAQAYVSAGERAAEEERISKYSTSIYRAPEMVDLFQRRTISEKVDIWALGCILYSMAFNVHPFQEGGNLAIVNCTCSAPALPAHDFAFVAAVG